MGYFNYFIKCIIRRITYIIVKPKILIFLLVFFCVFLGLKYYGFCADNTVSIEGTVPTNPTDYDSDNGVYHQYDNQFLTLRNLQEQAQIGFINKMYLLYGNSATQANAKYVATLFMNDLIYAANGTRYPIVIETDEGFKFGTYAKESISPMNGLYGYTYPYQNYVGAIGFENVSYSSCTVSWRYMTYNNTLYPADGVVETAEYPSAFYNVYVDNWIDMFLDFGLINSAEDSDIISKLEEIINSTNNTDIKDAIEEGNKIQQEQNDILTDDNVEVSSDNNLPTNDTNDITLDGFNSIFDTIKNAFTSNSSADIVLNIPFTSKSITINYNNVFGGFNFGVLSALINSFWFFIVCLFIAKDIKDKINKIKSGNIEDVQNSNIKGDLL